MAKPKPAGVVKWLYDAPRWLYRARLGFLMGNRFLMIEHRGRKSGKLYRTVLEVAGRNPDAGEWIVASGWGPNADWYRNLRAGTFEALWIRSTRTEATVRFLGHVEAGEAMGRYEKAHPKAAMLLYKGMGVSYDSTHEGRAEMMKQVPMVAFTTR